jgi:hypothetical protein
MTAGCQDRQRSKPLPGEDQHGIDVFTLGKGLIAVYGCRPKVARGDLSTMGHGLTNCADLKAVAKGAKRRPVPHFPRSPQTNKANA